MCEINIMDDLEKFSLLSDREISDYIKRLCPNCTYLFFRQVIVNQDVFSKKNITVSLIKHAWMYMDFYETYLIEKNK